MCPNTAHFVSSYLSRSYAVDAAGSRLRLSASATKREKARWVYLPEWLREAIEATCPLEDRVPERRVFEVTGASAYQPR
jgi:hypothetical protein